MSVLGIDLGTTSVKITLYDANQQRVITSSYQATNAYVDSVYREQDVNLIWQSLQASLTSLGADKLRNVKRIAVSGQMHGLVLWRRSTPGDPLLQASTLITWEDQRCSSEFLDSLPVSKFQKISTGFGCASLFWLSRHRKDFLDTWQYAGTIADLLVTRLCGLNDCLMSPQNAASWGFFDTMKNNWEEDILSTANFPLHLLPKVAPAGQLVGHVTPNWDPLPPGAAVFIALGDLQASVLAALRDGQQNAAVLNVGTSSQLALPLASAPSFRLPPGLTVVPFWPSLPHLAVAASLNGGNVLAHFVATVHGWCAELGLEVPAAEASGDDQDPLWRRLEAAAKEAGEKADALPEVRPLLFGERHLSGADNAASVCGLRPGPGLRLGALYRAVCAGLMANLRDMAGPKLLGSGISRVVGTGSALRKNAVLRDEFLRTFASFSPEVIEDEVDASLGAAMSVAAVSLD